MWVQPGGCTHFFNGGAFCPTWGCAELWADIRVHTIIDRSGLRGALVVIIIAASKRKTVGHKEAAAAKIR
jgi:hypothetical protein